MRPAARKTDETQEPRSQGSGRQSRLVMQITGDHEEGSVAPPLFCSPFAEQRGFSMKFKTLSLGLFVLTTGLCGLALSGKAADPPQAGPVQIGMVQTLFNDIPQTLVTFCAAPFSSLLKEQTGVDGNLTIAGDGLTVGKLLHENKYH